MTRLRPSRDRQPSDSFTVLRKIASVGGWTLVSRITGFLRDTVMAAVMGAGPVADAFVVAMRLPNHFRAIFAEGAFNAAFVPSYAKLLEGKGKSAAQLFADRIMALTIIVQTIILVVALLAMSWIVWALTGGFPADPSRFELAVTLSRITFPYLFFVTLVTILSGVLNSHERFATAAAAPILLNLCLIAALFCAFLFPTAGHAAAWGFMLAGILELVLLWWAAKRAGVPPHWARPRFDADMKGFFKALGPAVIGSAGIQIAMFADTIIASYLPTGALSSLYYADRLYQLPVGVIGIAAGTVLLPEMARRITAGDVAGAHAAQNRAIGMTLALTAPFLVAFSILPELTVAALFERGAFSAQAAQASGHVLAAYALGLPAMVLLRSAIASFYARQDTMTPVIASLTGVVVNVGLKIFLMQPFGAAGLALATSIGAWVNFTILVVLAYRRDLMVPNAALLRTIVAIGIASAALVLVALFSPAMIDRFVAGLSFARKETALVLLGLCGTMVYGLVLFVALKRLGVQLSRK